ncbi:MAG TPA: nucleotidyltransferase domain-containing protein [Anaerolineales bacterium]|nr:nucleotidyltransferase domain-containing protein [Anaerolineales bacterium]HLE89544.1 nucleotidyltransferase domain-containing protein [Anaerolineales bacterium]
MKSKVPVRIRKLMKELKEGLVRIYGDRLKGLYLYGSYARGEARSDSDIDVMIVLNNYESYGKEIDRTGELASSLSLEYGISISRVVMKETQWKNSDTPLLRNIRVDGVPA